MASSNSVILSFWTNTITVSHLNHPRKGGEFIQGNIVRNSCQTPLEEMVQTTVILKARYSGKCPSHYSFLLAIKPLKIREGQHCFFPSPKMRICSWTTQKSMTYYTFFPLKERKILFVCLMSNYMILSTFLLCTLICSVRECVGSCLMIWTCLWFC